MSLHAMRYGLWYKGAARAEATQTLDNVVDCLDGRVRSVRVASVYDTLRERRQDFSPHTNSMRTCTK